MTSKRSPSDLTDSPAVTAFFGSAKMRCSFDGQAQLQAWLDVEAALARAQASLGLIPAYAAASITKAAKVSKLDVDLIFAETERLSHPIVPLVRALADAAGKKAGRYVHLGATTQDIMDTGYVLLARHGLEIIEGHLNDMSGILKRLALRHRKTAMAGRTHGQHALPTTFGLRAAGWYDEIDRHLERINQMRPRLLVGSFGGAAGTLAGYGPKALQLRAKVMAELKLGVPKTSWHANQDRFAECLSLFGLIAATGEKLGREVFLLGRLEVGEAFEMQSDSQVGSSTMPQKKNPIQSEAVIAAAQLLRAQVTAAQGAMVTQDDRDMGAGMVMWKLLPDSFVLMGGLLERLVDVLQSWRVDPEAMARNLGISGGVILSEAVMLCLAKHIGREDAHHAVTEAVRECETDGIAFLDCLERHDVIGKHISRSELERLLDPKSYLGLAAEIVDAAVRGRKKKHARKSSKPK
jgi:3-carboxy-cis,cis-muconate cycloisomerase